MARLDRLPELKVIRGFKGTIDFYVWKGIPVARRWPRSPTQPRTAAVQAQWPNFRAVRSNFKNVSPAFFTSLGIMASGTMQTNIDVWHSLSYGKLVELGQQIEP